MYIGIHLFIQINIYIYIYVNASVSCPPQAHCMPKRPHIFGFHSASNGSVCAQQLKAAAAPHLVVELEESCKGDQDVVQLHQKQASDASSSIHHKKRREGVKHAGAKQGKAL